jgi:branched-chain amino acid transport system permease protein
MTILPKDWRGLLLLAIGLGLLPCFLPNDYFLLLFNIIALNALVVLGLNLLIGSTGQVSLGHAAFYGMGAYLSAIASTTWQWPLAASLAFAVLLVGATSLLLALPTLRLEGHYLVMATLGFNIIVSILLGHFERITGGPSGFPCIPKLHLGSLVLSTDRSFYYFIWAVFLIVLALTINLADSRIGRALKSIHERELTAQALGIPSHRYKVTTFVLSALYAALAGFCYAHYVTFISPKTFDILYSVQIVTMVVVGGLGSIWGGLAGVALLTALPEVLRHFEDLCVLFYGLILTAVLVFCRRGLVPTLVSVGRSRIRMTQQNAPVKSEPLRTALADLSGRVTTPAESPGSALWTPLARVAIPEPALLTVQDVSMSFGGLQALHEVTMDVYAGEIVALIGPNGAGKTTLLNIISGLLRPQKGSVLLREAELTGLVPHQIAARGIGRTFQTTQIYQHFNVLENVLLGLHNHGRSGFLSAYLHTPRERREEKNLRMRALSLLEDFKMAGKALSRSQELSLFEHKLLELARALALSPWVLLLDEPVGGLSPRESEALVERIAALRQHGLGIILVEHDMNVVMRLADRVVVLQHGSRIALGTPKEIQNDPKVIAAYLGRKRRE